MMQKIKSIIKTKAISSGLYEKFEFSKLHLLYARFNNPLFFQHQKEFLGFFRTYYAKYEFIYPITL